MDDWEQWGEDIDNAEIKQEVNAKDDEEAKILAEINKKEEEKKAQQKKEEEEKEKIKEEQSQQTKTKKQRKNNYEQKFNDKNPHMNPAFNMPETKKLESDYQAKQRRQELVEQADSKNISDMLGGLVDDQPLANQQHYQQLASIVGELLNKADKKNVANVVMFIEQLLDKVYPLLSSKDYEAISQKTKVLFNTKQKDEKPKKKKATKPSVNVGNKNISAMNDAINFDSSDDQKQGNQQDDFDFM